MELDLTTVAGVSGFTFLLSEVLFRAGAWGDTLKARFGPLVALIIGVASALVATYILIGSTGDVLLPAVVTGVVGGLSAVGLHDTVSKVAPSVT